MSNRVTISISEKDLGMGDLEKFLKEAKGMQVRVGILGKSKAREDGEPFTNAQIAAANEFGSPERGIPERPFMRMTWEQHLASYMTKTQAIAKAALEGRITVRKGLSMLGLQMVKDTRATVLDGAGVQPPNSPATIRQKVEKGMWRLQQKKRNSKKTEAELMAEAAGQVRPLVDTGAMMQAMAWEVRRGDPKDGDDT